ncbi:putative bifunctional diguanylate cyclase/phosphodiesterase [Aurantiacibacter suaedae]|uniref:putative bifunctional diguanylate cyclase/phosphodiesterase n=1 Tax=Aurantiacibacter suaedae TaxID=2545755 RepID=UPI0010F7AD15|nr:EAL domain-containing protein [Aurantiacibacter suaedae]
MQQHDQKPRAERRSGKADHDIVALGIITAAIILFVGTGGSLMPKIIHSWMTDSYSPDVLLSNAVLLNIALLIFGWRRYSDLKEEVRERRLAEQRAQELAEIDPLTGCFNRRAGLPAIDRMLSQASTSGTEVAVMVLDLDNFKQVNDLKGHQLGDRVLQSVAERLGSALPAGSISIRMGGDEFACAMAYSSKASESVEKVAANIIDLVKKPITHEGLEAEVSTSLGIASTHDRGDETADLTAEELIHRADIAMYQAKKRGRNRHFWFEPAMETQFRLRNKLEGAIRRGIALGEFVPYYEQQIDIGTGELVGFEMLARWKSPQYGLVNPDVFIPIAEECELIAQLSESLIRQALRDAKDWAPHLTLSVNISPIQMRDPAFAQRLLQLLVETGFPPTRLEVEITETSLHENLPSVRAMAISLKNQGIKISLDDFGTGYASLAQLRNLPFDRLKIDRSFVAELAKSPEGGELVEAIVLLGNGMNLPITAEGIETPEVLEALKSLGKLKGQGYLYGRPEDAAATRARLSRGELPKGVEDSVSASKPAASVTTDRTAPLAHPFGDRLVS